MEKDMHETKMNTFELIELVIDFKRFPDSLAFIVSHGQ